MTTGVLLIEMNILIGLALTTFGGYFIYWSVVVNEEFRKNRKRVNKWLNIKTRDKACCEDSAKNEHQTGLTLKVDNQNSGAPKGG